MEQVYITNSLFAFSLYTDWYTPGNRDTLAVALWRGYFETEQSVNISWSYSRMNLMWQPKRGGVWKGAVVIVSLFPNKWWPDRETMFKYFKWGSCGKIHESDKSILFLTVLLLHYGSTALVDHGCSYSSLTYTESAWLLGLGISQSQLFLIVSLSV
jgi:hypothetical protein